MTRTLSGLYDSYDDATCVVKALEESGIDKDDISLLANKSGVLNRTDVVAGTEATTGAEAGATFGAIIGGATGLLAGLGMLVIPGVGPVVAAGWLVATAVGAAGGAIAGGAGGGLIGAMISNGVSEEDAHIYAESIRRGGCLVTARVANNQVASTQLIMAKYRQIDTALRGRAYRETGWNRFDENAPLYTEVEVIDPHHRTPPPAPRVAPTQAVPLPTQIDAQPLVRPTVLSDH